MSKTFDLKIFNRLNFHFELKKEIKLFYWQLTTRKPKISGERYKVWTLGLYIKTNGQAWGMGHIYRFQQYRME